MILPNTQPTWNWREPQPVPKGLDARVHGLIGVTRRWRRSARSWRDEVDRILAREKEFQALSDHELRGRMRSCRETVRRGGREAAKPQMVIEALAGLREAADRTMGLRPYPEQLWGALALHRGWLAEMATGEGKTLTAGLAAVLMGWTGRPLHVVTVNDYLANRDSEWLKPLHEFVGLKAGVVTGAMNVVERRTGHLADVTYTTGKELLADFLRDRLAVEARRRNGVVLRGLHAAIVDEADSVLIDEAVTPLIIAEPRKNEWLNRAVTEAQELAENLVPDEDYTVNARHRDVEFTRAGESKMERLGIERGGIWKGAGRRHELFRQAVTARELFHRGRQYLVNTGKVVIVDEFTGRPMANRTWREGLHQAVEAKEGIQISDPSETVARMSFQRFFRGFPKLSGMTGTAREATDEFWRVYQLPVVRIPTHRPCLRESKGVSICVTEADKWKSVVGQVGDLHRRGRPVLIGTRSVVASERVASLLEAEGLRGRVLNARNLEEEAGIVALAGEPGWITIATNMAGRGTDIRLGQGVAEAGGLHVILTEFHESGRVDRQLMGRSARQGDPGSAESFASAEDELFRRFLPPGMASWLPRVPGVVARWMIRGAQKRAQKLAFRQREAVLRSDQQLRESLAFAPGAEG